MLRTIWEEKGDQVEVMTEKQWYNSMYEKTTMTICEGGEKKHPLCRVERLEPRTDWEESWRKLIVRGLGPENTSFFLKMTHDLCRIKNESTIRKDGTTEKPLGGATWRDANEKLMTENTH